MPVVESISEQLSSLHLSEEITEEIIACARYGELSELQDIIKSYPVACLASRDTSGNTALHMASANGYTNIVEYIIQTLETLNGIVNVQNELGNTPLHWSALNGHIEVVTLLIKNKAGRTAMYEAQQNNHEKVVEYLLSKIEPEKEKNS
ncbi:ankyrin repeat-containing domain protein [Gigaspora rosea]|uniref:Ankyrin repeat-containing domain protein n=1 Tax=Gigaspora rosea TaxID=44941 RepID=A0A397U9J6_9GLOM|nr:ankyrin repeat-containing domain protein [Gigaspora rosea]